MRANPALRGQYPLIPAVRDGFSLLTAPEKRTILWIGLLLTLSGLLEISSITALLPFINIVVQPEAIHTSPVLGALYTWAGAPPLSRFLTWLGGLVVVLTALSAIAKWSFVYVVNHFVARCQQRLATDILREAVAAPYEWFLSKNATTVARLIYEDVVVWSRNFVQRSCLMANDAITALMAFFLVLKFSPALGLLAIAAVVTLAALGFRLTRPRMARWARVKRQALDTTILAASQALAGIRDVKLSARERFFTDLFEGQFGIASDSHARGNILYEVPSRLLMMVGQIALVLITLFLLHTGMDRGRVATELALLVIVTTRVIPALSGLSATFGELWNAFPYVDGILKLRTEIRNYPLRVTGEHARSDTPELPTWREARFEGVSYTYPGAQAASLEDVSVTIRRGESLGLVGRSGAGKSTFVDLFVGLLQPTAGRLCIDETDLSQISRKSWQRRIGYVPQTPFIVDDTLRANIAFGVSSADVDEARMLECIRLARLDDVVATLPQGMETRLGDRGVRFSGGQRQRIAIARALYNRPDVLVFDEATSALDAITEREILSTLDSLRGQLTLIIIAHRLHMVSACDRIALLENGRLLADGRFETLRETQPLFQKMLADMGQGEGETLRT